MKLHSNHWITQVQSGRIKRRGVATRGGGQDPLPFFFLPLFSLYGKWAQKDLVEKAVEQARRHRSPLLIRVTQARAGSRHYYADDYRASRLRGESPLGSVRTLISRGEKKSHVISIGTLWVTPHVIQVSYGFSFFSLLLALRVKVFLNAPFNSYRDVRPSNSGNPLPAGKNLRSSMKKKGKFCFSIESFAKKIPASGNLSIPYYFIKISDSSPEMATTR